MFILKKPFDHYYHPLTQLLVLVVAAFSLGLMCMFVSYFSIKIIYNIDIFTQQTALYTYPSANPLRLYLAFSNSIGLFALPAWWFLFMQNNNGLSVLHHKKINIYWIFKAIVAMLVALPLMYGVYAVNQNIDLPASLQGLEDFMRNMELEAEVATQALLKMPHITDLLLNLLVVAALPAVAEELFFRGAMQQIFTKWLKNKHLSIWLVAIFFSALHFQFYGFLPRMFLGALFGYLYLWSGSILVPMLAHFTNNGVAVLLAYLRGRQLSTIDENDLLTMPTYYYVISAVATAAVLYSLYWQRTTYNLPIYAKQNNL